MLPQEPMLGWCLVLLGLRQALVDHELYHPQRAESTSMYAVSAYQRSPMSPVIKQPPYFIVLLKHTENCMFAGLRTRTQGACSAGLARPCELTKQLQGKQSCSRGQKVADPQPFMPGFSVTGTGRVHSTPAHLFNELQQAS